MEIFIRQLPDSVTRVELAKFINQAIPSRWSLLGRVPQGEMIRCQIIKVTDIDAGITEFHGWADIEPVNVSQEVIEKLKGISLRGKRMKVRKFYRRSRLRDRRKHQTSSVAAAFKEKRKGDQRRPNLVVELLHADSTHSSQMIL